MKPLFALLFFGLVSSTAALSQTQTDNSGRPIPAPVVPGPFQALGNVIRNPDADPPRRRAAPVTQQPVTQPSPPPTIIPNGAIANPDGR